MKYKSIDGKEFPTRREVRDHLQKQGLGKNITENYIAIPENSHDEDSVKVIKGYKKKLERFS